jgi:hypothetical protein
LWQGVCSDEPDHVPAPLFGIRQFQRELQYVKVVFHMCLIPALTENMGALKITLGKREILIRLGRPGKGFFPAESHSDIYRH